MNAIASPYIVVNEREVCLGRLLEDEGGRRVFYRPFDWRTSFFRKWEALSFDTRLLPYFTAHEVKEIHCRAKGENKLYVLPTEALASPLVRIADHGDGRQIYVPLVLWEQRKAYRAPWAPKECLSR